MKLQKYRVALVAMSVNLMLLGIAATVPLPVLAVGTCGDTAYGAGWESPNCGYSCLDGEVQEVAVWGAGDIDYVDGTAGCAGGQAFCQNTHGARCGKTGTTASGGSNAGTCEGNGYVGWGGKVSIRCWSSSAGLVGDLFEADAAKAARGGVLMTYDLSTGKAVGTFLGEAQRDFVPTVSIAVAEFGAYVSMRA